MKWKWKFTPKSFHSMFADEEALPRLSSVCDRLWEGNHRPGRDWWKQTGRQTWCFLSEGNVSSKPIMCVNAGQNKFVLNFMALRVHIVMYVFHSFQIQASHGGRRVPRLRSIAQCNHGTTPCWTRNYADEGLQVNWWPAQDLSPLQFALSRHAS